MKIKIIVIAICFPLFSFADDLDHRLRQILREQNIEALSYKTDTSSPLYKLGEKLFEDKDLSGNKNISCQTCHHPDFGSSDKLPLPIGAGGIGLGPDRTLADGHIIPRNSPHLINAGITGKNTMFWDGRVRFDPANKTFTTPEKGLNGSRPTHPELCKPLTSALSAQAMFPPLSHHEMRGEIGSNEIADAKTNIIAWERLTNRIVSKEYYKKLLKQVFPNTSLKEINFAHLAESIGHFQANRFVAVDTPFDKYLRGDQEALSKKAKKGAILFFSTARCFMCHSGSNLTDDKFHNVAFPQVGPGKNSNGDDKGLYNITGRKEDLYKFKTPSLRNVALTGPFGHSGSLKTLKRVVEHYKHPMRSNHHYDGGFRNLPYELPVDWDNMNTRLRLIDPQIGRMGIPMNGNDVNNLTRFLEEGLTQTSY